MKNVITKTLVASAISTAMLAGAAQAAVTMVSWGGGYSASQQKAYVDTYSSGEINMISYNGGLGEVRAQVESGNVVWDINIRLIFINNIGKSNINFKKIYYLY